MPRASFNPDKAKQGSSGIENGNYLVTAAKVANVEGFGKVVQPALVFTAELLDKDGDVVRDADSADIQFTFGPESAKRFSPGNGTSMTDIDPTDLGKDIDVEGNTLYCDEGAQLNASAAGTVFFKSLGKHGFPTDILEAAWAPAFVGLKFRLESLPGKEINEKFGLRLNEKPGKSGQVFNYKVATKWLNPDYLGKNGAGKSDTKTEAKSDKADAVKSAPSDVLKTCVERLAKLKSGKGPIPTRMSANGFLKNEFSRTGGPGKTSGMTLPEFNKILADDELVKTALMDAGAELGLDDNGEWTGSVTFA